jgi:hypothetical protein
MGKGELPIGAPGQPVIDIGYLSLPRELIEALEGGVEMPAKKDQEPAEREQGEVVSGANVADAESVQPDESDDEK